MGPVSEHFHGCHSEDAEDHRPPKAVSEIADTESCWHCGTPTSRGCSCPECLDSADYVPPSAIYHCDTCGRWWAYMTGLKLTTIEFGAADSVSPETGSGG